jgi:hypothetical protein
MKRFVSLFLTGLALLPFAAQAQLYGISLNGHNRSDPGPSSLYVIDPATGAGTLMGDIEYPVNSIAIDPTTGLLYAATPALWGLDFEGLLLIDRADASFTKVGEFDAGGGRCVVNIMFDSTGQMFGRDECSPITRDGLVKIDKATAAVTDLGPSGFPANTATSVHAFDSSDTLHFVDGYTNNYWIFDAVTGLATLQRTLSFHPGSGGSTFDSSDSWWAPAGTSSGRIQDSMIRITNLAAETYVDLDTDIEYLNALALGDAVSNLYVKVTKTFSDGNDAEVDVMLSCNSGLPLEQTFTIAGGDEEGVTFVVTDIPESGADCEVTESGSPAGYTSSGGCAWEDVTSGFRVCKITNTANPATYTVEKEWAVFQDGGDVVIPVAEVTIECDRAILNDDAWEDDGTWYLKDHLGDGESLMAYVDVTDESATCSATEDIDQSGVESVALGCSGTTLSAGGSHTCTFTNTVFFEGIPTLSQYGLALLALLTLGVGFVGLRRFV